MLNNRENNPSRFDKVTEAIKRIPSFLRSVKQRFLGENTNLSSQDITPDEYSILKIDPEQKRNLSLELVSAQNDFAASFKAIIDKLLENKSEVTRHDLETILLLHLPSLKSLYPQYFTESSQAIVAPLNDNRSATSVLDRITFIKIGDIDARLDFCFTTDSNQNVVLDLVLFTDYDLGLQA